MASKEIRKIQHELDQHGKRCNRTNGGRPDAAWLAVHDRLAAVMDRTPWWKQL